ncbi:hypothetical protein P170DRAFT_475342 [Aspergillus steynii IBT 23096]|uniref:Uncharacterized protein n=1 Tax=Aspergillus steynii IBT 23096 TaxID=1392250 RepID=A0A2I2G819_9EURO|nr:uncharacterized protein P170DRAFT_475342 [Aspergillus steynii IBT 23096]PLB49014.1 hypothetical protein P170DRAFT_475342 [Aspergillus steynii IBT 23096]
MPLFRQQQEVLHRRQLRQKHGEHIVNTALITFLQSIKELIPEATKHWSAEQVSFKANFGTGNRRPWRVLVAQDGPELYVSFLEYGLAWEEYITKNRVGSIFPVPAVNLARVWTYGPWTVDDVQGMLGFAKIILAILLHP